MAAVVRGAKKRRRPKRRAQRLDGATLLRHIAEACALLFAALIAVIAGLGWAAERFGGIGLWSHLLPFALSALGLGLGLALLLRAWLAAHAWMSVRLPHSALLLALAIAAFSAWLASRPSFHRDLTSLRLLVGGPEEAERVAIAHQVYAAYRRADPNQLRAMFERARLYEPMVHEAADAFGVDPEILVGIGATESAFLPRDSADGGRGIFQITAPPAAALDAVRARLQVARIDPRHERQNAFTAAATLRVYLDEMNGDLFLGLLAYNIGPRNGGLRFIMQQYGARDFVTIQPYLRDLPRDYPIRVLSAALAYRLWHTGGQLLRYEEGDNALRIQRVGIPGFAPGPLPRLVAQTAPTHP